MKNLSKVVDSYPSALSGITSGMTIMAGGFGLCGIPEGLLNALSQMDVNQLTCISNNAGIDDVGLGALLKNHQIVKMIASYVGENRYFESLAIAGKLDVTLIPQGTLAEKIRAGGAGIPGFYTPTGYGTLAAAGKEIKLFNGKPAILETALRADVALIKAWRADPQGNLMFRKTARNFNPIMATAADLTLVEAEEIVALGDLDPDHIHTPGIYVNRIVQGTVSTLIEKRTISE